MVRVALAYACPLIRQALKEVLRKLPDLALEWETDDLSLVQQFLKTRPTPLLVLEPVLRSAQEALRLVRQLHAEFPRTLLLIYTHAPTGTFQISALRAGASAALGKDCAITELISALHRIACGRTYLSPAQAEEISVQFLSSATDATRHTSLSPREEEVLDGIAEGKRLKEIGADLFLSPKTVHTYKTRIMARFHLFSNADLIRFAQSKEDERLSQQML